MARRRFQRGSLRKRVGKTKTVWVAQWREDVLTDAVNVERRFHKEVLGTISDFPTRKLAQRELDRRLAEINSPDYRARPNITFGQLAEKYQCLIMSQLKPSTQQTMRGYFRGRLARLSNLPLKDFSTEMLQGLINFWQTHGLSAKSIRNLVMCVKSCWTSAKSWGYVTGNPFDGLVLPRRQRPQTFAFSLEEVRGILAACSITLKTSADGPRPSTNPLKLFLWIAAETGLRAGELAGLTWHDIKPGSVTVRQTIWRGRIGTPKTATGSRSLGISKDLTAALVKYRETWRPNDLGLIFATRNGRPWDTNQLVKRKLWPILDKLGIKRCGLHAFRHTNASLMNQLNVDIKTRQARLGHASAEMTLDVYTHAEPEADKRVAEQLGAMLTDCSEAPVDRPYSTGGTPAIATPAKWCDRLERQAPNWQQPRGNA